jgi:RND family efflux transporter MFP subunit
MRGDRFPNIRAIFAAFHRSPTLNASAPILVSAILALAVSAHAEPVQGVTMPFKQVSVSSPVLQEVITEVLVDEGSEVKEGQAIVQLRSERERIDVELSEKLIELKEFIARGQERLFKEKMGSQEKALEARTDLELARLQRSARQVAFNEKTVRAPIGGIVVKKHKEAGESVDRAEKLIDIVNIDRVLVQFYLAPGLRDSVKQDQPIAVKILDLHDVKFDGRITFIDPRNDAASGLVRVKVQIENADHRIKPGMKASAEFAK